MVYRRISDDNKMTAVRLRLRGLDTVQEIKQLTAMSQASLYRVWNRFQTTGSVAKSEAIGRGRPRKLTSSDSHYLVRLARYKPSMFLDEYCKLLDRQRSLGVSLTTIHRTFIRAGLSVKRVQKLAKERSPRKRADYIRRIGAYSPACLFFLDETSKDDRTYARLWGRARKGERVEMHAPFVRKRRLSMVAGLALDEGIAAVRVLEGSYTRDTFLEFLREDVVRNLTSDVYLLLYI